jgi:hypothetical protein
LQCNERPKEQFIEMAHDGISFLASSDTAPVNLFPY